MQNKIGFNRGESKKYFENLSPKEKKIINDFRDYCAINTTSRKLEDITRVILLFRKEVRKSFDRITLKDLQRFLSKLNQSDKSQSAKADINIYVRKFLKWKFKDWSSKFNDFEDINTKRGINEEKINSDTLLKKEEVEKIMRTEHRLFWKTFFITLYESGLRPIELKTLTWKQIELNHDGEISKIHVYATKTKKSRDVYVKQATYYLKKLKEEKQNSEIKTELVFPSPHNPNKTLNRGGISVWLRELSKKAIGREIFPYILRHTRASELYLNANIPDSTAQKFMGHSKDMKQVYTHLSSKDVKDAMSKTVYKTEELPPQKKHKLEQQVEEQQKRIEKMEQERKEDKRELKKILEGLRGYNEKLGRKIKV